MSCTLSFKTGIFVGVIYRIRTAVIELHCMDNLYGKNLQSKEINVQKVKNMSRNSLKFSLRGSKMGCNAKQVHSKRGPFGFVDAEPEANRPPIHSKILVEMV